MNLILTTLFMVQASTIYCYVFRDVFDDIHLAEERCTNDFKESDPCLNDCVMKQLNMFDSTGKEVNMSRMHAHYRSFAKECIQEAEGETSCTFSDTFLTCLHNKAHQDYEGKYADCDKKYPVEDKDKYSTTDMSQEEWFNSTKNMACQFSCYYELLEIFTENDEFDTNLLRLNSSVSIDVLAEAEKCYKEHQEEDICLKKAMRVTCLDSVYTDARELVEPNNDESMFIQHYD